MWEAIAYISSGLTLAGFFAAVAAWLYGKKSEERARLIEVAPESDRAVLVQSALEFFHVDTSGLTREQRYELAFTQIKARVDRFRLSAIIVVTIAILAAAVAAYAISKIPESSASTSRPETTPLPVGSPETSPRENAGHRETLAPEVASFTQVRPGASKRLIEAKLGPPSRELLGTHLQGAEYLFDTYYLRLIYGVPSGKILMCVAAARDASFTPSIPYLGIEKDKLGSFTFKDVDGSFDFVNMGQAAGFSYVESGGAGWGPHFDQTFHVIYSDAAHQFGQASADELYIYCYDYLVARVVGSGILAEDAMDTKCTAQWNDFREKVKPNAFSVGGPIPAEVLREEGDLYGPFSRWAVPLFDRMCINSLLRGDED